MYKVNLTWMEVNSEELGFNIYRDASPLDIYNLPPPVVTLPPNTTNWEDEEPPQNTQVYYIVSTFDDEEEVYGEEINVYTGEVVEVIYLGQRTYADDLLYNIYAGKPSPVPLQWKNENTATLGALGSNAEDGKYNTDTISAMGVLDTHPAINYCVTYRGDDKDDWFLPSSEELTMLTGFITNVDRCWSSTEHTDPSAGSFGIDPPFLDMYSAKTLELIAIPFRKELAV